jgi:hypothetical protein
MATATTAAQDNLIIFKLPDIVQKQRLRDCRRQTPLPTAEVAADKKGRGNVAAG